MERFSSRIIKFSASKDYVGANGNASFEIEIEGLKAKFYYTVNRERLSGIFYTTQEDRVENGIFYALCTVLKSADIKRIISLSAREVESFLRDENHIPAMGDSAFPTNFIELFKNLLLASILREEVAKDLEFSIISKDSSYVDRIRAISDFFTLKINMSAYFVQENIEIELIQLEEADFFVSFASSINGVKMAPNSLSIELLGSIQGLVRSVIQTENINLVAE